MLAKQEMIEYWLKAGVDLSGLNVQVLGLDSKEQDYLYANVYLCSVKRNSFDNKDSDIRIRNLGDAFPLMRKYHNGEFESYIDFLSPYGRISVVKIHESVYCYMESHYSMMRNSNKKAIHLNEFLKTARQNFHIRRISSYIGDVGC